MRPFWWKPRSAGLLSLLDQGGFGRDRWRVVPHGDTRRRVSAIDPEQAAALRECRVRMPDHRPRSALPPFDERGVDAGTAGVCADSDAVTGAGARHAEQTAVPRQVGTRHDPPR